MKDLLKLDLQLFADDDFILPDDFEEIADEAAQSEAEETLETESKETTNEEVSTEPQKIKVKYNSEEKELTIDEAVVLAQKGMNYDKLQERLNQLQGDPSLKFIEQQAKRYNMTPEQYIDAVQRQEEQAQLDELLEKDIPPEIAQEMLESRRYRETQQAKETAQQTEQQKQKEMQDFISSFPDVKATDITPETWVRVNEGTPLKQAYMEQERQILLDKIKILEQNNKNKEKAPIKGVTNHGSEDVGSNDPFLDGFNSID